MSDVQSQPLSRHLPKGWARTNLGSVVSSVSAKTDPAENGDAPYVGLEHIVSGESQLRSIGKASNVKSTKSKFLTGDILYGKLRPYLNKVALPDFSGICSTDILVLRPEAEIERKFVEAVLRSAEFVDFATKSSSGINLPRTSFEKIAPFEFSIAPTNEQKSIAAKLRHLLDRERKLRQQLDELPELIKQYRATVLEAACTGRLVPTEAELARKERRDFESASVLLERILIERRAKWEANQLAKMRAAGKEPKDDKWKERYKEPLRPQISSLPSLPPKWCWAGTEELTAGIENAMTIGPFGSNLKVKDYKQSGVPLVFVREIRSENFRRNDTRYISPEKAEELASHKVRGGDVVITKMGEPPGDTSIYPRGYPDAIATSDCLKLTPNLAATSAEFLKYIIRSQMVKNQILDISRGVAQQKMSLARFKTVAIPLPPLAEQQRIVVEVERHLSALEHIEAQINTALDETIKLRAAIFHRALSGKFVDQHWTDEPAKELLARIRIEREKRKQMPKRIQIKRKSKMKKLSPEVVKAAIAQLPSNRFSFDELSTALQADYDPLKDMLFELLDDAKPALRQVFNAKTKTMQFERIEP